MTTTTTVLIQVAAAALCALATLAGADAGLPEPRDLPLRPELPDPLIGRDEKRVGTAAAWRNRRRPELEQLFRHYMYGFTPPAPPVRARMEAPERTVLDGKAVMRQVALALGPEGAPEIHLMLLLPARRIGPAPAFLGIAFCGNQAILDDPSIRISTAWMYPTQGGVVNNRATEESRGKARDVWNAAKIIEKGYVLATFYNGDVDPDYVDFTKGVQARLRPAGQPAPKDDDWGSIAAWAWGASRAMDYLVTVPEVDAGRVAVVGHSRNGKAALVAGAFDERFALAIPHQAGCGGTAPSRGTVGESVKQINDRFPHWFARRFREFNDSPQRLPFDQHCLVALMAPRPVLLSNAVEDTWANPDGQFEVLRAADPVYRLLEVEGLQAGAKPEIGHLVPSRLGYFLRGGKHSMTGEDWDAFLSYAEKNLPR
jgi:hypothetical protein